MISARTERNGRKAGITAAKFSVVLNAQLAIGKIGNWQQFHIGNNKNKKTPSRRGFLCLLEVGSGVEPL